MAQLYANENFPTQVVARLHDLGHDVLTSHEAGNSGRAVPDDEVLRFAMEHHRVLISMNRRHFHRLHQLQPEHCGIVTCTLDLNHRTARAART